MTRRWLIVISLLGHLTLAFGLFVAGVWHIDQMPAGRHVTAALATMSPPAAAGGAPLAARKVDIVKKPVHEIVQPTVKPDLVPTPAVPTTTSPDPGEGSGSGAGSGSGDDPTGTGGCTTPPCGIGEPIPAVAVLPPPKPPATPKLPFVAPVILEGLRISGQTQIHPPEGVANQILRDNRARVTGGFRVCLGAAGEVASVTMALSTKYPAYDALLAETIRTWRYKPYLVDNRPTAVCGNVTFIFAMH